MGTRLILAGAVTVLGAAVAAALVERRRRRRRYARAVRAFTTAPAEKRDEAMRALLREAATDAPAWYLLGCTHLRASRMREAARAFGFAHHCDCNLETAALLTFACLKAADGAASDIVEQILVTWEELGRPDPAHRVEDRQMLRCLAATTREAGRLAPLGRLIWLVTGPAQQARLERMLATRDPRFSPLRAPASH